MRKYVSILFVSLVLSSCISLPKPGDKLKSNKLYIIGRINTGIDLDNFFNGIDTKKLFLRMIFHRDSEAVFPGEK